MPSSYTPSLRLTLPVTGELSGQWGTTVNNGITELLDSAVAGTATISTWGGAGVAYTLTSANGAADEARKMFIVATGAPGEAKNVICPAVSKLYVFRNNTTGGFALTLKTSGGTGIAVAAGQAKLLYCDGTNVVEAVNALGPLANLTASQAVFTDASKNLVSNAITGTGNVVMSASPTLTGTVGAASLTLSSLTSGRVTYAGASGLLQDSANLTFNGTDLTVSGAINAGSVNATTLDLTNLEVTNIKAKDGTASASIADSTGVMSLVANPVFSGGTANGVLYLNGSKVATSGSALTFDGTNFGVGTSSTSAGMRVDITIQNGFEGYAGLQVRGPTTNNAFAGGINWVSNDGTTVRNSIANNTGGMIFGTNNAEQMRLTSTGLGIGTSSPTNKLTVDGNANVTGNVTLGDATTDTVQVNGYMGVGGAGAANVGIYARNSALTAATQSGVQSEIVGSSAATSNIRSFSSFPATTAAAFTNAAMTGFYAGDATKGAGSTITNQHGVYIADQTQGTNNYGITSLVSSGTNKWNIYASGTAANYFAGNVGIGTSSPGAPLHVAGTINSTPTGSGVLAGLNANYGQIKLYGSVGGILDFGASGGDGKGRILYNNASNFMAFGTTNGVEQMRLDTSGNLGIGTSSPGYKLDVSVGTNTIAQQWQGAGTNFTLRLRSGNGATPSSSVYRLYMDYLNGSNTGGYIDFYRGLAGNDGYLVFGTAGSDRMTLDSSGNLGLGVTPSAWNSGFKALQVSNFGVMVNPSNGNTYQLSNSYFDSVGYKYLTTAPALKYEMTSGVHAWYTAPSGTAGNAISFTQAMTLDASGNLGIGTTSPGERLYVSSANGTVQIGATNGTISQRVGYCLSGVAYSGSATNHPYALLTNDLERMRITSAGDVGIGTSSPGAILHTLKTSAGAATVGAFLQNSDTTTGTEVRLAFAANTNVLSGDRYAWIGCVNTGGGNSGALTFATNVGGSPATERMRLDSSGNLGLGVTPSAWNASGAKVLQIGAFGAFVLGDSSSVNSGLNAAYISGWQYVGTGLATRYEQQVGQHRWYTAPSGTAGNAISFTQAMTLDASGNLLVGTTSASGIAQKYLDINATANCGINLKAGDVSQGYIYADDGTNEMRVAATGASNVNALTFYAGGSERARITSGGDLLVGKTAADFTVAGAEVKPGGNIQLTRNSASNCLQINKKGNAGDLMAFYYNDTTVVGTIANSSTNTAYNTSSDRRLKENIAPAADAGAVIDAIEVVQHDWKVGGHTRFGVIAQDLNAVAPEAVSAGDDGEEIERTWGVDYSKLVPMLIKEIQSLRARVAALESQP